MSPTFSEVKKGKKEKNNKKYRKVNTPNDRLVNYKVVCVKKELFIDICIDTYCIVTFPDILKKSQFYFDVYFELQDFKLLCASQD